MSDKTLEIQELFDKFWKEKHPRRKDVYKEELTMYLLSKLSQYNIPTHTIMEIAQYAIVGTMLLVSDEVDEAVRSIRRMDYERIKGRIQR